MIDKLETILSLKGIGKSFGGVEALHDVRLDVVRGEFLTLLGPSGCGKTTTLRIIAGLESPDDGEVWLNGENITAMPPNKRSVNTVFQSYALFPHMNVRDNVGYGLKIKGVPKETIRKRVREMLEMVRLPGYEKRMPTQLSGGQRQRVAIARALVNNPDILLLDEPLGALDLQLRRQMQEELKHLQRETGITFVYITHDQEEALNTSDRIGIMNEGRIEQLGAPDEIYERPRTSFAARFIGQSNLIKAECVRMNGSEAVLAYAGGEILAEAELAPGKTVVLSIRAERVDYNTEENWRGFSLRGIVEETRYAGGSMRTTLRLADGGMITVSGLTREDRLPDGTEVNVFWNPKHAAIVPETPYYEETGR